MLCFVVAFRRGGVVLPRSSACQIRRCVIVDLKTFPVLAKGGVPVLPFSVLVPLPALVLLVVGYFLLLFDEGLELCVINT